MSSFHPLRAYWIGPAPDHQAFAAGLAAQVRSLSVTMHADDGLLIELPAGMGLFLERREGGCAEFAISRPDWRLPFGAVEEARLEQIVSHIMGALVRDLSAVACFVGWSRREHMLGEVEEFDGAMASWVEPASLPLERLGRSAWMRRWRAASGPSVSLTRSPATTTALCPSCECSSRKVQDPLQIVISEPQADACETTQACS